MNPRNLSLPTIHGLLQRGEVRQTQDASTEQLTRGIDDNLASSQALESRLNALAEKVEQLQLRVELAEAVSGQASARSYRNAAIKLKKSGKYALAELAYVRAFELDPANAEHLNQAGVIRSKYLKDPDAGERYYRAALAVSPAHLSAIYNLACCLARRGDVQHSLRFLAVAILGKDTYRARAAQDDAFAGLIDSNAFTALVGDRSVSFMALIQTVDTQAYLTPLMLTQTGQHGD